MNTKGVMEFAEDRGGLMLATSQLVYTSGYKYVTAADTVYDTTCRPGNTIITPVIVLRDDGWMLVRKGYPTDGPSGPTVDRKTNMRGAVGHDALYELMRNEHLPQSWRERADDDLERWWKEDGMWGWLAESEIMFLRQFGAKNASPARRKKIKRAP